MFETVDYCDSILNCSQVLQYVYVYPGFLLVVAMAILAKRNPAPMLEYMDDVPKMNFFKQCFWIILVMFGGSFVVSDDINKALKRNSIIQKAITMWCVVGCIILVSLVENYEMVYETMLIDTTRQIYSGDYQIRDIPTYDVYIILARIETFFSFLAIILYVGLYKSSSSSVFFKIRKFLGLILLWFTYTLLTCVYTLGGVISVAISLIVAILLLKDYRRNEKEDEEVVTSVDIPL